MSKLKSISNEELQKLRETVKGIRCIRTIKDYPDDNTHLQAHLSEYIGMDILYNADQFILKYKDGKSVLNKNNKWVVVASTSCMFYYNKEFDDLQEAVDYAYDSFIDYCNKEIERVNEVIEKIKGC